MFTSEILAFFIILIAIPYVIIPFVIRREQTFFATPKMRQIMEGFLPNKVARHFLNTSVKLKDLGFIHKVDILSLDFGPGVKVFLRLFVAEDGSGTATSTFICDSETNEPLKNFIEFNSLFENGTEISTHNSDLIGAPIEARDKIVSPFLSITDEKLIYEYHKKLLHNLGLDDIRATTPDQGQELNFVMQNFTNDLIRQESLGCLHFDKSSNCYRPTWAGAFLLGWYSMWPITQIRRILQRAKAKLKLRALAS